MILNSYFNPVLINILSMKFLEDKKYPAINLGKYEDIYLIIVDGIF